MTRVDISLARRALIAGAVCLVVLGAMAVQHAWPLWTGRDVLMSASILPGRQRSASGEFLRLSSRAELLKTGSKSDLPEASSIQVRPIEPWVESADAHRQLRGRTVYVQLEADATGDYVPVSVSLRPAPGAVNLRGICTRASLDGMHVDYGLDAFFLQQDRASAVRSAGTAKRRIQMLVAISSSGRARIREVRIDGSPVG